jgi:transposase-like protein
VGGCCLRDWNRYPDHQSEQDSFDISKSLLYTHVCKGDIMDNRNFSAEQKAKLTQIINEGMQVMHEIETLNGGLSDTIKAVAEELDIKPNILKKAIRIAHKAEFGKEQQDHSLLENILTTVGKTL